jgi:hypothetical protein
VPSPSASRSGTVSLGSTLFADVAAIRLEDGE